MRIKHGSILANNKKETINLEKQSFLKDKLKKIRLKICPKCKNKKALVKINWFL